MNDCLPLISVIVPVYNNAEGLRQCLDALSNQSYPRDRFEVIVVDNGSKLPPRDLVKPYSFCSFVEESAPGSYAARNRGLEIASGDVLAFTDSDCIPSPGWLAAGQQALANHPDCGFVGGKIELFPNHEKPTAVELYDMIFGLRQKNNVERLQHAATANMFTTHHMMNRGGPFDARVKSGGDLEWGQRMSALGLSGVYAEAALVRHPARRQWVEIVRQVRRHAGGRFDRHMTSEPYQYTSRRFWRTVRIRLVPNFRAIREARRELKARGFGTLDWLRVSCVILGLQYSSAFEFVRLWFGRTSERR